MILNEDNTLLLIIDIQEKLLNVAFNKDILYQNSKKIVKAANILNLPIFVTEQYPKGLGETVDNFKQSASLYIKNDFNALTDMNLLAELKKSNRTQVIVFGIETHICVYQTVEALIDNGFDVFVVKDACASRSEVEYSSALLYMDKIGANIKTTEMLLFELIKSSKHPMFKEIQSLVK